MPRYLVKRAVVDALVELLREAGLAEPSLKLITARSAVRAGWEVGILRGPVPDVMPARPLLVRASAVADVTWLPPDTTHLHAIGRDATTVYCIADTHDTIRGPVARVMRTLYVVNLLDEDAWVVSDRSEHSAQKEWLDDLFNHAHWWD